jgi:uncharacterized protein with GYD domain
MYPGGGIMPKYLFAASYTLQGLNGLRAEGGSSRAAAVKEAIEAAGGKLESIYFAFGENDVYVTVDFPDNVTAAGFALVITASGAVNAQTVVLLTAAEVDAAVKAPSTYRPPGS